MRSSMWRLLAALALGISLSQALVLAEENKPAAKRLVLSVGATYRLQMTTKKPIKTVINERADVARVDPVPGDPTTVLIKALAPGWTRITLISEDGDKEVCRLGKAPAGS